MTLISQFPNLAMFTLYDATCDLNGSLLSPVALRFTFLSLQTAVTCTAILTISLNTGHSDNYNGFLISLYNAITEGNAETVASFLTNFMETTSKS